MNRKLSPTEAEVLKHLRENSRKSLTQISKETNIPISTVCDIVRRLEQSFIKRYVSLVDFPKLGFSLRMKYVCGSETKNTALYEFLYNNPSVNSLFSLGNSSEFLADCFFRQFKDAQEFKTQLNDFDLSSFKEFIVIDEHKRENFRI